MAFLLQYLELILSGVGVAVVALVPGFFFPSVSNRWLVAAWTAIAVGIIHGLIFFAVRQRQRTIRRQTIRDMQMVVDDLVRNQLQVISLSAEMASDGVDTREMRSWAQQVSLAAKKIDAGLQQINAELLTERMRRYTEVAER